MIDYVAKKIKYFENYFEFSVSKEDAEDISNQVYKYCLVNLREIDIFILGYLVAKGYIPSKGE